MRARMGGLPVGRRQEGWPLVGRPQVVGGSQGLASGELAPVGWGRVRWAPAAWAPGSGYKWESPTAMGPLGVDPTWAPETEPLGVDPRVRAPEGWLEEGWP